MNSTLFAWRLQELLRYYRQHGVMSAVIASPTGGRFMGLGRLYRGPEYK